MVESRTTVPDLPFSDCISHVINYLLHFYPKITRGSDLCAYYHRQNKAAAFSFLVFSRGLLCIEALRVLLCFIDGSTWRGILSVLVFFAFVDTCFVFLSLYAQNLAKIANEVCFKADLAYQTAVRWKLQCCALVPTAAFILTPLFMRDVITSAELAGGLWLSLFIMQSHICCWMCDGVAYKLLLMVAFNIGAGTTWILRGNFSSSFYGRMCIPIALATLFLVSLDIYVKENFTLKRRMKQQKRIYEEFLEKVQDSVIILENGRLLFCNEAARNKLDMRPNNFARRLAAIVSASGESLHTLVQRKLAPTEVSCDDLSSVFDRPGLQTKDVRDERYYMKGSTGGKNEERVMTVTVIKASAFLSQEKAVSIALHDLTSEITLEAQRVEDKYKNMLMFSLSHELRTPLNIFQAFLTASKHQVSVAPEIRREAKSAWRYLRNKISDILDYTQILAEEFSLHELRFSLHKFVGMLRKLTLGLLEKKAASIKLEFSVDKGLQDAFKGDRERLEQIMFNFISNAARYTSTGVISLRVFPEKPEIGGITFEVADTGCGMSPERVASLFALGSHRAEDLSRTVVQRTTGLSGLGLTVSRMLCLRMGSDIRVKSELRKGSAFSFTVATAGSTLSDGSLLDESEVPEFDFALAINRCRAAPAVGPPAELRGAIKQSQGRKGAGCKIPGRLSVSVEHGSDMQASATVLIVDDNELNRFVAKGMLQKLGFRTEEADTGRSAIEKLKELQRRSPTGKTIIFMDVEMPVMDGIEATIRIRAAGHGPAQPSIIALTAFSAESERVKCLKAGMDGFISKPLTKENLRDVLENLKLIK